MYSKHLLVLCLGLVQGAELVDAMGQGIILDDV